MNSFSLRVSVIRLKETYNAIKTAQHHIDSLQAVYSTKMFVVCVEQVSLVTYKKKWNGLFVINETELGG